MSRKSAATADESDDDRPHHTLRQALKEQYAHVEAYGNAQTKLHHAMSRSTNETGETQFGPLLRQNARNRALEELAESIARVRSDFQCLQSMDLSEESHKLQEVWKRHLETSRRVVDTIFEHGGRLHANGVPATKDDYDTKLVALATLRASIAQVESLLSSP
jgi:sirohydrochlorin ferrochelatase